MISEDKLRELLDENTSEVPTVDFKLKIHYPFGNNDDDRSEFIKDILSMANTPREEAAYIVIGVKYHSDKGTKDLIGVLGNHPDDAQLQDCLNPVKLEPRPAFSYQPRRLDGCSYGVIEIPLTSDGPYCPMEDFGKLKRHCVYFRRGSKNEEATLHERKQIYDWFHNRRIIAETGKSIKRTIEANSPKDEFDTIYDILSGCIELEQKEISREMKFNYRRLEGNSHAERAYSLVEQMENQGRLPELKSVLRRLFPERFS